MAIHLPLELEFWFVSVFSGGWAMFSIVSILAITSICSLFKMPTSVFLILLVAFSGILLAAGQNFLIVLLIFILAPVLFWQIRRVTE
jgi:hypothetical protein